MPNDNFYPHQGRDDSDNDVDGYDGYDIFDETLHPTFSFKEASELLVPRILNNTRVFQSTSFESGILDAIIQTLNRVESLPISGERIHIHMNATLYYRALLESEKAFRVEKCRASGGGFAGKCFGHPVFIHSRIRKDAIIISTKNHIVVGAAEDAPDTPLLL